MKNIFLITSFGMSSLCTTLAAGHTLCIPAHTASVIEMPVVQVTNALAGASGPFLEIPEGAGNPPKRNEGLARFPLNIPADADYTLWCRVFWEGECSNSFRITFDDQPAFLFGEDATYKTWHWVKYPVSRTAKRIHLTQGPHILTFHNREDGVRLDQILISTDKRFVPVDIEPVGERN